jgi:uncharacterized protein YdiU (UPF0061 family)
MYDGHPDYEKGPWYAECSILYPFWEFRTFPPQNDLKTLKSLADFSIKYHFPEIKATNKESYIQFFREVASKTREMVVHWQRALYTE